jgi:hypothetical protein
MVIYERADGVIRGKSMPITPVFRRWLLAEVGSPGKISKSMKPERYGES